MEAVNEFIIAKARAGRSDRYLRQLRVSLASFTKGRARVPLGDVTVSDVEKWLFNQGWQPRTMRGYLADVRTLYNFAVRRGYVKSAAACQVELPDAPAGHAPGIHTPAEVAAVLAAARRLDLDVMRHLAVRYFAGVRSAEAHRMTDANILEDRGVIEVPAHKAKTRRRRLVEIQPALSAWLALGGHLRPMSPDSVRRVIRASGVEWKDNVTRHSFVSYAVALRGAKDTAMQAGHSEDMLFAHYRALVTMENARQFWNVLPVDAPATFRDTPPA
jgi:integrase